MSGYRGTVPDDGSQESPGALSPDGETQEGDGCGLPLEGDPLHLTAEATLKPNQEGDVKVLDLKNPNEGSAMLLTEIKWQVSVLGRAAGATVGCQLALGSIPLTSGYVPVWNFGKLENPRQELYQEVDTSIGFAQYVWKLKHPIYVHPGETVVPAFQHRGYLTRDIDVKVSYACRSLPRGAEGPRVLTVPYVACFNSKAFKLDGSVQKATSDPKDLLHDQGSSPLHIERFVGRLAQFPGGNPLEVLDDLSQESGYQTDIIYDLLSLKMTNSRGDPIVRNLTPFRAVFDPLTRSWEIPHVMMPGTFYKVNLRTGGPAVDGFDHTQFMAANISMVGWREIEAGA